MRQIVLPILGLLITLVSAQSHALSIEWDKCAGYKEARAYRECRVYYGYTSSGAEKDVKTLTCRNVGAITFYEMDVKNIGGELKVRSSSNAPWKTPSSLVQIESNGALVGHQDSTGEFVLDATCLLKK